jgi:hypothetical protein
MSVLCRQRDGLLRTAHNADGTAYYVTLSQRTVATSQTLAVPPARKYCLTQTHRHEQVTDSGLHNNIHIGWQRYAQCGRPAYSVPLAQHCVYMRHSISGTKSAWIRYLPSECRIHNQSYCNYLPPPQTIMAIIKMCEWQSHLVICQAYDPFIRVMSASVQLLT